MFEKRILTVLAAFALSAHAVPVYLTFTGTVEFSGPNDGMTPPPIGTPETIVVMVDRDAPGYYTDQFGTTHVEPMTGPSPDAPTFFYSQFISGPGITGGSGNPYGPLAYNYSWDYNGSFEGFNILVSPTDQSSNSSRISIKNLNPGPQYTSFEEGQAYWIEAESYDNSGLTAVWYGNFTLSDSSSYAPGTQPPVAGTDETVGAVPEPGSLALMAIGMLGLVGMARRRRPNEA